MRRSLLGAALLWMASLLVVAPAEGQREVRVRAGDTLAEIARRERTSVRALQQANGLRGESIRLGQTLRIPPRAAPRRSTPRARRYVVRAGDTLARIARRHRTSVTDLREANGLRGDDVRLGQVLHVPRPGQSGAEVRAALRSGRAPSGPQGPIEMSREARAEATARAQELGLGPDYVAQRILRSGPDPSWVEAAGEADGLEGTLLHPVEEARFLRGWGSGADGYHLAVDLGAPPGTEVRASERGIVAYASRGIRGYGNFVILVHPNGWVTAYAHHQRNLVVPGQRVERGEVIALVGATGFARGPHLHYMLVIPEGQHCDPVPLMRPMPVRADGEPLDEPQVVWDAETRPSAIRCLSRDARPHPYHRARRGARRR